MEKQYGITMPLSTNMPTDAENRSSNALIEELKKENNYESVADTQKRYVISILRAAPSTADD